MVRVYPEVQTQGSVPFSCWCCVCFERKEYILTEIEQTALITFKKSLEEPKEGNEAVLMELFNRFWSIVYSDVPLPDPISPEWKKLGFQSANPSTDVRSGLFPMRQVVFFAENFPDHTKALVQDSLRKECEYPFAACCFNVSVSSSQIALFILVYDNKVFEYA